MNLAANCTVLRTVLVVTRVFTWARFFTETDHLFYLVLGVVRVELAFYTPVPVLT